MATRKRTEIYSIFGQIEAVAAQKMIDDGVATKIDFADIPVSAMYNNAGDRVRFAIIVPHKHIGRFEKLIADLRA